MNLTLTTAMLDGRSVLAVQGEVDVHSVPVLRERLQSCLDAVEPNLIVDLSEIAFIDSTGLGVLVAAQNRASELGGMVRLVCPQDRVLRLFRITGLDRVFPIFASRMDAVAALAL